MNRQFIIGLSMSTLVAAIAIFFSYHRMTTGSRMWGMYGETALITGAFEVVLGLVLVCLRLSRQLGAGVLCGALLTLLMGYSICSAVVRF